MDEEPIMMIEVKSNNPELQLEVSVENFKMDGEARDEIIRETPFNIALNSMSFELTLKLVRGESDFTARTLRKGKEGWVGGGLTGIGKLMDFTHTKDSGRVTLKLLH